MNNIYYLVEVTLILLWFVRVLFWKICSKKYFDCNYIEIFLFYFIWLINCFWAIADIWRHYLYYFVHLAFPIVLSLPILAKISRITLLSLLFFLMFLSLYFSKLTIIVILNLSCVSIILTRIVEFSLKSRNYRQRVPVYVAVLAVLIVTQLIFLTSYVKVNWYDSLFVDYFLYFTQFVYLSTIIIGHVYLRRFIVN